MWGLHIAYLISSTEHSYAYKWVIGYDSWKFEQTIENKMELNWNFNFLFELFEHFDTYGFISI